MLKKAIRYTQIIRAQQHKGRFILSRLLMRSGLSKNVIFTRNDYKLRFHPSALTASLWINPKERLSEEHFLTSLINQGDTVVDIGANIGTVALALTQKAGHIIAFEPHPKIFKILEDNIKLNTAQKIVGCHHIALGEKEEVLYFSDQSDDTNNAISDKGLIPVSVKRLDDVITQDHIHLLKIDVEGYEYNVLKGAPETCKKADIIYLECIPSMLEKNNASEEKICDFLKSLNFKVFQVNDNELIENTIGSHNKKMLLAKRA